MPSAGGSEAVSETCTVITTLLDHEAAPAEAVREAYLARWSASETTFGEDKTTIAGAGNRTSGPVLRSGSPRLVIQEAWAWLTATQLTRAGEAQGSFGLSSRSEKESSLVSVLHPETTALYRDLAGLRPATGGRPARL